MFVIHWNFFCELLGINGYAGFFFFIIMKKRKEYRIYGQYERVLNHEKIHIAQGMKLFIIGWWIWYIIEHIRAGYKGNMFEKEAHENDHDFSYHKNILKQFWKWSWLKYR